MPAASARANRRPWLKALLASTSLCAAGSLLAAAPGAHANPQGGQVVGGGGSIVQSATTPNRLVVSQTTQNLVLDWQSFSIGAGQQVVFQQPDAGAIALNRVTGGDPSTIAGQLTANGQVWLVNPNGVFFSRSAVVNVAGIVATTSHIDAANFMAGNYVFGQPGAANAAVVNAGRITVADAGLAAFVAPAVANSGVIAARLGKVALVSGSTFTVDLYGDNLVKLAVDDQTGAALAGAAVSNSGKIEADGGTVLLSVSAAESIVNTAINVSGTIEARTAALNNGKIVLSGAGGPVVVSGTLDASGKGARETGGTVAVLGAAVDLAGTATIDVSGDAGGGTALIGGNFHGAGPAPNAATTSVAAGAVIDADAITTGNGGEVALWSDQATDFAGSITAKGGAQSGNGGFVETSSGNRLTIADGAIVNTAAANGKSGEWLLDPVEIDITAADNNNSGSSPFTATTTPGSTVANTTIDTALGTGDVVIETFAGDIAVDADIVPDNTLAGNHSLGLASSGSIVLNANINFAGATGGASSGSLYLMAGTGSITQTAGAITLAGGELSMQAATGIGVGGAIAVAGASASTVIGVAAATSTGGIAVAGGTGIIEVISVPAATLSGVPFGATTGMAIGMASGGTLALTGGSIVVAAPLSGPAISLTGTSGITFDYSAGTLATSTGGGQVYNGAVTLAQNATLADASGGPITFVDTIDASAAGAQALTIIAAGSTIALDGAVGATTPLGAISLTDTVLDVAANVGITTASGAVSQTGATVLLGSATTIDTTAGGTALGANIGFSGTIDGTAAGAQNLTLTAGSGTVAFAGAVGGTTPLGAIALTDAELDLGANVSIVTSGGAVSQTGATVLLGGATGSLVLIETTAAASTGADIAFSSTIDGTGAGDQALGLDAGASGTLALSGAVGAGTALGAVTLSAGGSIAIAHSLVTSGGDIAVTSAQDISITAPVASGSGAITLAAGGGLTIAASVGTSQAGPVSLGGATISLVAAVDGGAALTIGPGTGSANIGLGSGSQATSDAFNLSQAELNEIGTNFTGVSIATGSGTVHVDNGGVALSFTDPATITAGAIALLDGGGFSTSGKALTLAAPVMLGNSATLDTTAGSHPAGADVTLTGAVTGSSAGGQSLTINAGTAGTIALDGALGTPTALGSVTLSDAVLDLAANVGITTSNGAVTETGRTVLLGSTGNSATTIATSGGAITFAGTIDGDTAGKRSLTLAAGSGTITLEGSLGSSQSLDTVSLSDALLDLAGTITIATDDASFTESGATVLGGGVGATTVSVATSGGAIAFTQTIDGDGVAGRALVLKAGAGTISLGMTVGSTTPLASVTLTDAQLDLAADAGIATNDGAVSETGNTVLAGAGPTASTISTSGGAVSLGAIDGTSSGSQALVLETGAGTLTLSGAIGAHTPLGALTLSDGQLALAGGISLAASAFSQSGPTLLQGSGASSVTIATSGGAIDFAGTIDGNSAGLRALVLAAGSGTIALQGNLGGATALGAVTLSDGLLDLAADIGITTASGAISQTGAARLEGGGAATLDVIDTTSRGNSAGANIAWGTTDGTGAGHQALSFAAGSGTITLAGNLGGTTALGAVTLSDALLDLGANLTTSAAPVMQSGATVVTAPATIDTTASGTAPGSNIVLSQTVDGGGVDPALTLTAGTGTILLQGNLGSTTPLAALTFNDALLELGPGVSIATSGGAIAQNGATALLAGTDASSTLIDTTAADHPAGANIAFAQAINAGAAGGQALTLNAGTGGTISLSGNVGAATALGAVTLDDGTLDVAANLSITTSGATVSQTGDTVFLGGVSTASTIATVGGDIIFAGPIDGGSRGDQALTLSAGTGTVTLSGNVGTGTALGALSFTGAELDLGNTVSVVTSGGAVIDTGALVLLGGATAGGAAIDTTAGGLSSGADITLAKHVDATGSGKQGLSLNSGVGTIALQGDVGGTTPLGAVILHDAELDLSANVAVKTSDGAVSQTGNTVLGGVVATATTIATSGGSIAFGAIDGTVSGDQALRLAAGGGTITLDARIGGTTPLGAITLTDAALDVAANVSITTSSGNVSQTGATVFLGGAATASAIATGLAGNITFAGTVDGGSRGNQALTLDAGLGTVTFSGNAGKTTALGALSLTDAELDLGNAVAVVTSGGAVINTGTLVLLGGATAGTAAIDTTAGGLSPGAGITLANAVDATGAGKQGLALTSGTGTITLQANVGATTPLGALTVTDATLMLPANFSATTAGGAFSQTGATVLAGGAGPATTTIATNSGGQAANITFSGTIDGTGSGGEALSLVAGSTGTMSLLGAVGGTTPLGAISLSGAALDIGANVAIATNGGLVTAAAATVLLGGASSASITTGGANIVFANIIDGAAAGSEALALDAGAGSIVLQANIGATTPLGALTLTGAALDPAANIDIVTAGGAVAANLPIVLAGAGPSSTTIDTTGAGHAGGANITLAGPVDGSIAGDQALTLKAGSGGTIALAVSIGATTPLGAVTLSDALLDLAANVGIATASGAISQAGSVRLEGGATATLDVIDATGGGNSAGANIIWGATDGTAAGQQALAFEAGTGTVTVQGNWGGQTALGAVTVNAAAADLAANAGIATSDGAVTVTGALVLAGAVASASTIATSGGAIALNLIDGSSAGKEALTLDAGATGTILLQANIGAATPLGALTFNDALLQLGAGVSVATAGGAISQGGATMLVAGMDASSTSIDTTAANHPAGANIAFAQAIDAGAAGGQALTLNAGTGGTISLAASVGAATPLGAVTLSDATLDLAPDVAIVTSGAAVSETGAIILLAGAGPTLTVIDTTAGGTVPGAAIAVAGKIDDGAAGQQALTLDAGSATITLSGNLGRTTPLGALTLNDALLQIAADTSVATAAGAIAQQGAVVLLPGTGETATTIDTTGGGLVAGGADMMFGGPIDGGAAGLQALRLTAGSAGTITLAGNLGGATPLGALTMSDALLALPANFTVTTAGGAVSETGAVVLAGGGATTTLIDTTNAGGTGAGANITLAGPVDGSIAGAQALTLQAGSGGTIAISGNLGGITALGAVSLSDAGLALGADIATAGGAVSQTGATLIAAAATIATTGGAASGADIGFAGTIDAASFSPLALNAGSGTIALGGTVGGHAPLGSFTLSDAALDLGANVGIAASATFAQTGATVLLGGAQAATSAISAGTLMFAGAIDGTAAGDQALRLSSGGTIALDGNVGGQTPLGAITLNSAQLDLAPNVAIVTAGGAVSQTGPTALLGNGIASTATTIDTTAGGTVSAGAGITFAGDIEGSTPGLQALTLNAGAFGNISLGTVGRATALGALTMSDAILFVGANATIATAGGAITQQGGTVLLPGTGATLAVLDTTAGGLAPAGADVYLGGALDGSSAGLQSLTITAGSSGAVAVRGALGFSTALGAITLSDGVLDLGSGATFITAGGAVTETGSTVVEPGAADGTAIVDTTANSHPHGADITFAGTIDDVVAGRDGLALNAGTQGTISLQGNVGGATAVGALSFTDAVLALGPNVSITTVGDAVSETGATILLGGGTASAAAIDTTNGGAAPAGATITFAGAIDATGAGRQSLALDAGDATIALAADIGAHTALGALTLSDGLLSLPAGSAVTTAGGAVALTGATLVASGNAESLAIDTTAGGAASAGANITLGTLDGGTAGKLALTLDAGSSGTIALLGDVGSTAALASLSLGDAVLALGPGTRVTLAGTPFVETGATQLLGNGAAATMNEIDTTDNGTVAGASISFAGPIDGGVAGKQSLTLAAGSAAVTLGGSLGAATALGALTFSDATLVLGANLGISTAGGPVLQTGATRLLSGAPVMTGRDSTVAISTAAGAAAGAAITFDGAVDGSKLGGEALALDAGSGGTLTLAANVGATTPLGGLTLAGETIDFGADLYQTNAGTITATGTATFLQPNVTIATVMQTAAIDVPAKIGAAIVLAGVDGATTTLTLDPGTASAAIAGGTLAKIVVIEGSGSSLLGLSVAATSLGGTGIGANLTVGGFSGSAAATRAFIRPGGNWIINGGAVLITDPALAGLTNSVLNNEGIGPAIALMVQIQQLIARGDTGETAAQQAFDQYPDRSNYAADPFKQRYNILGVAQQEGVGGFEDISYIQDGFWEGLFKQ